MKKTILAAAALALLASGLQAAEKNVAVINGKPVAAAELTKKLWWQHAAQGLSELIDERLLLEEAARLGVKADPKEVETRYNALEAGAPSKAAFAASLKSVGWTAKDLKDLLGRQLAIRGAVIASRKLAVTDADAKSFFDQNKDRLGVPEAVRLSQIFVASKAEADDAYDLLTSVGADFSKLSALKSSDPALRNSSGSLGYISRGMLLPEIEKEIFALKAGQYTKPMATGAGFSLFKAEELRAPQPAVFDAIRENIKTALLNQAITRELPLLAAELRQKAKIEIAK
ncbi:MAG: peptidyl-prolyl cis-trans isomerase [Elusimicrobiales bacterium]